MKHIRAIIRPERIAAVKKALEEAGCSGLTISETEGHGTQKGIVQEWRGECRRIELIPKIIVDIVAKDEQVDAFTGAIIKAARTGEAGDGKIFIYDVQKAIRIRTGEEGDAAI